MDDMNKELNNYETEESVTQPEVTDNPSAEVNPEVVEEVTVNPVPEPQTEPIVDETVPEITADSSKAESVVTESGRAEDMPVNVTDDYASDSHYTYDPNGAGDEMPYVAPDSYVRNEADGQVTAGGQTGYTQPGAAQGSYSQAYTGGQAGYTQPGAAQGSYSQAYTDGQTGYTQPGASQGSYNQANA
ncbi:MAG: hypothetical protein IKG19_01570, partial [Lachnospiraceae bacterium]|nr:hypothetical protein [Lachnospiraceae bacterium]